MRIPIAIGHISQGTNSRRFRRGALRVVYLLYMSEIARGPAIKWPWPFGLALKSGHAALHIAHLEQLNIALRVLPGRI